LALIGIMFASSGLFPDTALFPRTPQSDGTIGWFLKSYFQADGTAKNTNMLSGVTASGYLQNNDCSTNPIDTVWVGVDADGRGICGNTAGVLTAAPIGHFSEIYGTVNIIRSGTVLPVVALVNQDLYAGDIIQSDSTGTGTIAFAEDASLLRFFVDTDLELRYGILGGNTVAEAILNDGSLWGRILTSTGVNIGGGGVVTGVRGTSVYITKTSTGYILNLVNSTSSANEVNQLSPTVISLSNGAMGYMSYPMLSISSWSSTPVSNTIIWSGTTVSYLIGASIVTTLTQNPAILLTTNQWIRDNTIADIEYMSNLLSGATAPALIATLNAELDTTVSSGDTLVAQALISGGALNTPSLIASGAILLDEENQTDTSETQTDVNKNKSKRQQCKKLGKTYFRTLGNCYGHWDDLAITHPSNFTSGTNYDLHGKKAKWDFVKIGSQFDGIPGKIHNTGNFLEYNTTNASNLVGKKIIVNLANPITAPSSGIKKYILDTGTYKYYVDNSGYFKYQICNPSCFLAVPVSNALWKTSVTISIPLIPSKLVFGANNVTTLTYISPLNNIINSISIQ
jgi:hypothetical protein